VEVKVGGKVVPFGQLNYFGVNLTTGETSLILVWEI